MHAVLDMHNRILSCSQQIRARWNQNLSLIQAEIFCVGGGGVHGWIMP